MIISFYTSRVQKSNLIKMAGYNYPSGVGGILSFHSHQMTLQSLGSQKDEVCTSVALVQSCRESEYAKLLELGRLFTNDMTI